MEHYIFYKAYIPKNKSRKNIRNSRFPPQTFQHTKNVLQRCNFSCRTGFNLCTIEYRTRNPTSQNRKFTQGSIVSQAEIFRKATPPAVPPRVPIRGVFQEKLQEVNQEITQIKYSSQSKPFTNAEPLRVPIVGSYP